MPTSMGSVCGHYRIGIEGKKKTSFQDSYTKNKLRPAVKNLFSQVFNVYYWHIYVDTRMDVTYQKDSKSNKARETKVSPEQNNHLPFPFVIRTSQNQMEHNQLLLIWTTPGRGMGSWCHSSRDSDSKWRHCDKLSIMLFFICISLILGIMTLFYLLMYTKIWHAQTTYSVF